MKPAFCMIKRFFLPLIPLLVQSAQQQLILLRANALDQSLIQMA